MVAIAYNYLNQLDKIKPAIYIQYTFMIIVYFKSHDVH